MKKGDMVKAKEGRLSGMLGIVTGVTSVGKGKRNSQKKTVDVSWANGLYETCINPRYLEIVSRAKK